MSVINVLTNNTCPNSRAFNFPLHLVRKLLEEKKLSAHFFYGFTNKIFEADYIFINSNVFRPHWRDANVIFEFLKKARNKNLKILWFDTTDSTWVTQFPVLPYVDLFLKSQIFSDPTNYLKKFRTGRIFTDFFDDLYAAKEKETPYASPDTDLLLKKIRVSWNTCFENYTEKRYGVAGRLKWKLSPYLHFTQKPKIAFTPPENARKNLITCRLGATYARPSIVMHRKAVIEVMEKAGVECGKIPLKKFFSEMRNSRIGIGPFGFGEITLRDFEIIICGCVLVKPDISHLKTWPELFLPNKTYIPHKWDLSDLEEKIYKLIEHPDNVLEIARSAQEIYKNALSPEGQDEFVNRLVKYLEEV